MDVTLHDTAPSLIEANLPRLAPLYLADFALHFQLSVRLIAEASHD